MRLNLSLIRDSGMMVVATLKGRRKYCTVHTVVLTMEADPPVRVDGENVLSPPVRYEFPQLE